MTLQNTFRSALAKDALRYVALKRTLGRSFENATSVLLNLDGFLLGLGKPPADLTPETFRQWSQALKSLSPNTRLARMRIVRSFCIYRRRVTPDCFVPDPSQFPKACPLLRPHIFSETEVARLLGHCDALPENPARSPLRWAGTRLAIVLLYTTGLRRGELFRLTPLDYDPRANTLLIRASKFHKSRLLPLPRRSSQGSGSTPESPLRGLSFRSRGRTLALESIQRRLCLHWRSPGNKPAPSVGPRWNQERRRPTTANSRLPAQFRR